MKKVFLSILFLFAIILSAVACYPESLRKIAKVDGIYYGYDDGWYVAGFENDQDSVVLKSKVVIEGKTVTVKNIYIVPFHYKTLHAQNGENTSPRVLVISDGFITIASYTQKIWKSCTFPKQSKGLTMYARLNMLLFIQKSWKLSLLTQKTKI